MAELESFFKGEIEEIYQKKEIFTKIKDGLFELAKEKKDPKKIWGAIYEKFVKEELIRKEEDTEDKELKSLFQSIINEIYKEASFFIGKSKDEHLGEPDGLDFLFKDGHIIIEIIEMKSTFDAYIHGRDSEQPKRTLNTIVSIAKLVNLIIEGRGNMWILSEFPNITHDKEGLNRWKGKINEIRLKLQNTRSALSKDIPRIDLSENIKYRIITPSDEKIIGFKPTEITSNDGKHKISVTNEKSKLSKAELYEIVSHYLERISK